MKSSDYTLPFYKKCLSQHLWDWRSRFTTTAVVRHHEANEEMLKRVAHDRGDEFLEAYNQVALQPIFPFAGIPAMEIPNETHNTTPMKIEINLPEELFNPLVQAINSLTEAVKANGPVRYTGTLKDVSDTGTCDSASTTIIGTDSGGAVVAKRGRKPKESEPTPTPAPAVEAVVEPVATPSVEPAVVEAPAAPAPAAAPVPTGPELAKKVEPLAAHPELQQELIRFKANELKINGPIRLVTDTDLLRRFNEKVDELLAKIAAEV